MTVGCALRDIPVRDLPSPNQDSRPAGTPVDTLILHYTGMQSAQAALDRLRDPAGLEPVARQVVERMALALQASLLLRHAPAAVSDAFCLTRLDGDWGHAFGALPRGVDAGMIVERAGVGIYTRRV